jgi:hypothetical protein
MVRDRQQSPRSDANSHSGARWLSGHPRQYATVAMHSGLGQDGGKRLGTTWSISRN